MNTISNALRIIVFVINQGTDTGIFLLFNWSLTPMDSSSPYYHELTLIPAWISNDMPSKVWDDIIHPFQNLNGTIVECSE